MTNIQTIQCVRCNYSFPIQKEGKGFLDCPNCKKKTSFNIPLSINPWDHIIPKPEQKIIKIRMDIEEGNEKPRFLSVIYENKEQHDAATSFLRFLGNTKVINPLLPEVFLKIAETRSIPLFFRNCDFMFDSFSTKKILIIDNLYEADKEFDMKIEITGFRKRENFYSKFNLCKELFTQWYWKEDFKNCLVVAMVSKKYLEDWLKKIKINEGIGLWHSDILWLDQESRKYLGQLPPPKGRSLLAALQ